MGSALYKSLDDLKSVIEDKWNTGSVDAGYPPRVVKVWEEKTLGFGNSRNPTILLKPEDEDIQYFSLYGTNHLHEVTIELDVRTYLNIENHEDVVNEIQRIVKDQIRRSDFVDLRLVGSESLSHLYRNMYRHILSVSYRKLDP
jgi:hypothetical protein